MTDAIEQNEAPPSPQGRADSRRQPRAGWGVGREAPRTGRPESRVPLEVARRLRRDATPQEKRLWAQLRLLREQGLHFRRQAPIGTYVVDFACLHHKLVVELDGGQHNEDAHATRDRRRDAALQNLGFKVLRFWNADVNANLESVVETICASVGILPFQVDPTPHPAPSARPSPEGRVSRSTRASG